MAREMGKLGWNARKSFRDSLNAMTDSPQATELATKYPVCFVDGDTGFYWSLDTRGLTLDDDGVTFTSERETRKVLFSEINSIRLHTTFTGSDDPPLGVCEIRFGEYRKLTVLSGNARGVYDDEQRRHFLDFVRAFHRRIPAEGRKRIGFHGGISDGRHVVLTIAVVAGAILFGLLPFVLLFVAPSLHTLGVAATSWGLCYGGWRIWEKTTPRTYSPDHLDDDLLP
jgi:hypothetical protein